MAWAAAIPAAMSALGSIFGKGGSGGGGSQSMATNTATINFNPNVVGVAGAGVEGASGSASSSTSTPQTTSNQASNPLAGLYSPSPYGISQYNPLIGGTRGLPGESVMANLSGSTLLLIGGLGLLMIMAFGGGGGKKRR